MLRVNLTAAQVFSVNFHSFLKYTLQKQLLSYRSMLINAPLTWRHSSVASRAISHSCQTNLPFPPPSRTLFFKPKAFITASPASSGHARCKLVGFKHIVMRVSRTLGWFVVCTNNAVNKSEILVQKTLISQQSDFQPLTGFEGGGRVGGGAASCESCQCMGE